MQKGAIHFIDFCSMTTKTNRGKTVALWLLAAAALGVSFCFDATVMRFSANVPDGSALGIFGSQGSHYGELQFLLLPCAIVALVAWFRRDAACLRVICMMVIASLLAGAGADIVRGMTGRTRPSASPEIQPGWYGPRVNGEWVVINPRYNAFPSAHAAASMGLIGVLLVMRRRIGWLLLPVPVLIAAARICANAHHLSDVVGGALLGIAVACWVYLAIGPVLERWRIVEKLPA